MRYLHRFHAVLPQPRAVRSVPSGPERSRAIPSHPEPSRATPRGPKPQQPGRSAAGYGAARHTTTRAMIGPRCTHALRVLSTPRAALRAIALAGAVMYISSHYGLWQIPRGYPGIFSTRRQQVITHPTNGIRFYPFWIWECPHKISIISVIRAYFGLQRPAARTSGEQGGEQDVLPKVRAASCPRASCRPPHLSRPPSTTRAPAPNRPCKSHHHYHHMNMTEHSAFMLT